MIWLIHSAMAALYPRTDAFPGVEELGLRAFLVKFKRDSTLMLFSGILLGAIVFHLTPLLTVYVPLPAFLLPRSLLDKHADRILSSRLYLVRQIVFLVKLIAGLCWGTHPDIRQKLGLPVYAEDPCTWKTT
jgi:hypothetical protein